MTDNKKRPKTHFKTNVLLKSILGKDLINNDNIAVLELIKNSFDAGSSKVDVFFKNVVANDDRTTSSYSTDSSKIIITDSGRGMDEIDFREKWLNIAYSEKKHQKIDGGRILAGAKGIGRLSCDRLAEYLDIYSKKSGQPIVHLSIDWKLFEFDDETLDTKDIEIQDIEVGVRTITQTEFAKTGFSFEKTGTIVEMSKLRSSWDEDKLKKLRHYLERLLNPNQSFGVKKFRIFLHASEFPKQVNGEIKNQIFEKLDFTTTAIESFISVDGKEMTTNLRDKGRDVFTIIEKTPHALLKDIKIVVYFLNTYSKIYFAKQTGLRVVEYGSIFLFKNGFRVSPYGDEGDDWLGLEIRKGQGTSRYLGTRDIVGRIEINDKQSFFREVTSREGLVRNEYYSALTNRRNGFFFETLKRLEKYVVDGLGWDSVPNDILEKSQSKEFQKTLSQNSETYVRSAEQNNRAILDSLRSIIRANPKTTIDLDINAELVASLMLEEREKATKVIKDLEKFGESKINSKTFQALIKVKERQAKKEAELKTQEAEIARKKAENDAKKADEARQKAEQSLETKKEQLSIVTAISSQDLDNVTNLHHQVVVISDTIKTLISNFSRKIKRGDQVSNADLTNFLDKLAYENSKIESISKFGTRAIFEDFTAVQRNDLAEFIENYVEKISKYFSASTMKVEFVSTLNKPFVVKFRQLDLSIIIDNMINNAKKAGATVLRLELRDAGKGEVRLLFQDNGKGLDKSIADISEIYEKGFSTTKSTGLGLFHIKGLINDYKWKIEVEDGEQRGLRFVVTIHN